METKYGTAAKAELESNDVFSTMLELGKEYKYNHKTCPAGEDKRHRLYVTNKGGAILYKCFNCGGSGHYREKESWSPIKEPEDRLEGSFDECVEDWQHGSVSTDAMLWLLHYEIDPDEFPGVFYSEYDYSRWVQIAIKNGDVVKGFQRRWFNSNTKYETRVRQGTYCHYLIGKEHPDTVFVVEDLLSSYKIWSLGYSVIALLGTSLKGAWPTELKNPKNVTVWLDNDTAGHAGAAKFVKEMSALFPTLNTIFDRQPKEVPYAELFSMCRMFA